MHGGLYQHLDGDVFGGMNKGVVPDPEPFGEAGASGDVPPFSYTKFTLDRDLTFQAVTCERSESTTPRRDAFVTHDPDACTRAIFHLAAKYSQIHKRGGI